MKSYTLYSSVPNAGSRLVKQWYILGSIDGINWKTLDTQLLATPSTQPTIINGGANYYYTTVSITNTTLYNYYRIVITNSVNGYFELNGWYMTGVLQ